MRATSPLNPLSVHGEGKLSGRIDVSHSEGRFSLESQSSLLDASGFNPRFTLSPYEIPASIRYYWTAEERCGPSADEGLGSAKTTALASIAVRALSIEPAPFTQRERWGWRGLAEGAPFESIQRSLS